MKSRTVKPASLSAKKPIGVDWEKLAVPPDQAIANLAPGMSVFIGTGVAEPRTLMKHVMGTEATHLQDLELIQLVSLGDAISLKALSTHRYRLKTFYSGWAASEAINAGQVDLITCNPPYISSSKVGEMAQEISDFEPSLAFDGGPFGVNILRRLLKEGPPILRDGGYLAFEVGLGQGDGKIFRSKGEKRRTASWIIQCARPL